MRFILIVSALIGTITLGPAPACDIAVLFAQPEQSPALANHSRKGLHAGTIDEMLSLPRTEIDVGLGALLIGKEYDPTVDTAEYLSRLDALAREVKAETSAEHEPKRIVAAMNRCIFKKAGFLCTGRTEQDGFLHVLLRHKKGNTVSLAALYLGLAERLGLPLYGVAVGERFFVRYDDGATTINIEPSENGDNVPDEQYKIWFRMRRAPSSKRPPLASPPRRALASLDKRRFLAAQLGYLGWVFSREDKLEKCLEASRKALAADPDCAQALRNIGFVRYKQDKPAEAVEAYKKALGIEPYHVGAWYNLGCAYRKQGKRAESVTACKKALAIDSKHSKAWSLLGNWYYEEGQFEAAATACSVAVAIDPDRSWLWNNLGRAYFKLGKLDESIRAFERATSVDPRNPAAWNNLVAAWYSKGEYAAAWKQAEKARASGVEVDARVLEQLRLKMRKPQE